MWDDLTNLANFILNTMSGIAALCMTGILVFVFGLFILELVIKFFKKIL